MFISLSSFMVNLVPWDAYFRFKSETETSPRRNALIERTGAGNSFLKGALPMSAISAIRTVVVWPHTFYTAPLPSCLRRLIMLAKLRIMRMSGIK
jgi:hypothetical protein